MSAAVWRTVPCLRLHVVLALASVLCGLAGPGVVAQGIRPDPATSQIFANEMQQDFGTQRIEALVDRFDLEGFPRRVAEGFGVSRDDNARILESAADRAGSDALVRRELEFAASLPMLAIGRVIALRGTRILECLSLGETGDFRVLYMTLAETAPGKVKIIDVLASGSAVSLLKNVRYRLILAGVPTYRVMSEDETDLQDRMRGHEPVGKAVLDRMSAQDWDGAFGFLKQLSAEVQEHPYWATLRDFLAASGSSRARRHLEEDRASGRVDPDPFRRYAAASRGADPAVALAAVDEASDALYGLPFLRLQRVGQLALGGRQREAQAEARWLCDLNPLLLPAHTEAIRWSARLQDLDEAGERLHQVSRVFHREVIDRVLAMDELLGPWRASPEYRAWLAGETRADALTPASERQRATRGGETAPK